MERLPSVPMPSAPDLSPYREYLPSVPSCPEIPLPEPVQIVASRVAEIEQEMISPLLRTTNRVIIVLSVACATFGVNISQFFVFQPNRIVRLTNGDGSDWLHIPYFWTLASSVFIEENLLFMAFFLFLMNYIVSMNQRAFNVWQTRDFVTMLAVSGMLATTTHLLVRLSIFGVFNN